MGFFDSLKSIFGTNSTEEPEQSKIKIPGQYLDEFQQSAEGQLQLIEANLYRIELVYPAGAREISETITQIRRDFEKNVDQLVIDTQLNALQEKVKKYTKKANQRYSIEEVKKSIHRIQSASKTVTTSRDSKSAFVATLQAEEEYIQSISNRISDFEGQERDLLIASLMEARYRVAMGKLIANDFYHDFYQDCYDFFKSVPEVEKIMYVKFLFADYNELISRYNLQYFSQEELRKALEQFQLDYPEAPEITLKSKSLSEQIDQNTNKIKGEFANDLIDDFQATGLFSNFDFLNMFAQTWLTANSIEQAIADDKELLEASVQKAQHVREEQAEKKRKEQQEKERRKQEEAKLIGVLKYEEAKKIEKQKELEEKYKNMSDAEIQDEITIIDSQTFDMKEKYRRIIEFQKIIAKTRGLISEKETMALADIAFLPYATDEIVSVIDMLNQNNIFGTAMLGVDDDRKTSVLLVSKADKDKIADISRKFTEEATRGYYRTSPVKHIGKLTANILARLPLDQRNCFVIEPQGNQFSVYEYYYDESKQQMSELYQSIQDMNDDETIKQKIKFSIQLPLQRSMLPVIEQLKQAGIEFYIPPIDIPEFDFKKSEPTYRIYIDRKYLEQYKMMIHPVLSYDGVVLIGDEQVNVADLMLSNCKFPYGLDKQKEK